jgi:hypothetical protein
MGGKGWRRLLKSENQNMNDLEQILKEYAAFEAEVNHFSSDLWFQWCSDCTEVCCKKVYCRETLESPFLVLLLQKHSADSFFDLNHKGWLNEAGCKLTVGRPPVCYEFLCGQILDDQHTRIQRYAMIVLAKLIDHIGKRALGSRHLIEIMDPAKLKNVKYSRFEKRLSEARNAIEVVQSIFRGDKFEDDALKILSKISNADCAKGK